MLPNGKEMNIRKRFQLCFLIALAIPVGVLSASFQELCDKAMSLFYQHKFDAAAQLYQKAITIDPSHPQALFNIGYISFLQGNIDAAIDYYERTLKQAPSYAKAHLFLSRALKKKKDIEGAINHCKQAVKAEKSYVEAHHDLGNLYLEQQQYQEALEQFDNLFKLNPNNQEITLTLAYLLTKQYQFERAIELYQSVLKKNPNNVTATYNLAYALQRSGRMHEAIPCYEKTISWNPDHEMAHFGLAKACLAIGDFKRGWQEFEWRMANQKQYRNNFTFHGMKPNDFKDKTVVIRAEWGMGDTMHFIRYAQLLKQHGAKIIVQTFAPLVKLFSLCNYMDQVISLGDSVPTCDIQIPLLSMPFIFDTTLETVPNNIPYLKAKPELIQQWKQYLKKTGDNSFKIGLCWQAGTYTFLEDNPLTKRSVPLTIFAPLAQLEGITFYSLQKQFGTSQLNNLPEEFIVHDFGPDLDTTNGRFMDTAAIIKNLDLVITVDTSIAHLAGALGTPVWIILPSVAEWRWMTEGTETIWYPNAQLFRQANHGEWAPVVQKIKNSLITLSIS
ncbi:tetratricopeptide repeat protein [Candidatus Dependentiae bacterium]